MICAGYLPEPALTNVTILTSVINLPKIHYLPEIPKKLLDKTYYKRD